MRFRHLRHRNHLISDRCATLAGKTGALLLSLGLLLGGWAQATPPPDAIEEGFGVGSAATAKAAAKAKDAQPPDAGEEAPEPAAAGEEGAEADASARDQANADVLEQLLAESPDERERGETCIARREVRRFEILSSELLLVHGSKNRRWINRFSHRCHGLRRHQALVIETRGVGARYCALDTVYGRDRGAFGGGFGSARCQFGYFQPVTLEQAELLKVAARNGSLRKR